MCAIAYCISITSGLCEVHRKHPTLGPLEVGHPTPHPSCTSKEAEYILQTCGGPPEEDNEDGDENEDDDQN